MSQGEKKCLIKRFGGETDANQNNKKEIGLQTNGDILIGFEKIWTNTNSLIILVGKVTITAEQSSINKHISNSYVVLVRLLHSRVPFALELPYQIGTKSIKHAVSQKISTSYSIPTDSVVRTKKAK